VAFRFLHAADLHLDTPFEGIGKVSREWQQRLRDASLDALDNLTTSAIENRCDFVLFAGDTYDGIFRGARAQSRLLRAVRQLDDQGVRSFFVYGNHDPINEGWSALREGDFPPSVKIFTQSDTVAGIEVTREDTVIAIIQGISFSRREEYRNLAKLFPTERNSSAFQIGLLHCNAGGQEGYEPYAPCSLDDLRHAAIDYWALGHIHKRKILQENNPTIVYPGNSQARSFKEAEPKGATLVDVNDFGGVQLRHLDLDVVRFSNVTVTIDSCQSLQQLYDRCSDVMSRAHEEGRHRYLVSRLKLTGTTQIYNDLLTVYQQNELVSTIQENLNSDRMWVTQVLLKAIPTIDKDALRRTPGFEADLLRVSDAYQTNNADRSSLRAKLSEELQENPATRGAVSLLDELDMGLVLKAAEDELLTLLQPEEQE
jgi:exonuclease SbcD